MPANNVSRVLSATERADPSEDPPEGGRGVGVEVVVEDTFVGGRRVVVVVVSVGVGETRVVVSVGGVSPVVSVGEMSVVVVSSAGVDGMSSVVDEYSTMVLGGGGMSVVVGGYSIIVLGGG